MIEKALAFLDAPSDLVPGVYEGGLKTWECSLDLVDYLDGLKVNGKNHSFVGKTILDVRFLRFKRMYGDLIFSQDWFVALASHRCMCFEDYSKAWIQTKNA